MTAENQTATMYSGDDQTIEVSVTDGAGESADLSGSDLTFVLAAGGTTEVEKTTGGGGITISGSDNDVAEIQLDAADTADLQGRFGIELQETDAAGNVATLTRGTLRIEADLIE